RRGLAARPARLPRRQRRLLGLHRREAPLHPLRHVSVRATLASGCFYHFVDRSLGLQFRKNLLAMVARAGVARGSPRSRRSPLGRALRPAVRGGRPLGRAPPYAPPRPPPPP